MTRAAHRGWGGWNFITEDSPRRGRFPDANYNIVGPQYFRTLGVPLQRGRPFTEADTDTSLPVVMVSEQLAIKSWPGQDPIGKRLKIAGSATSSEPWRVVIGVAGNVMAQGPDSGFHPELYILREAPWLAGVSGHSRDLIPRPSRLQFAGV